jgi:hypothetical protein
MIEETMILTKSGSQPGLTHRDNETYDEKGRWSFVVRRWSSDARELCQSPR